jgi:hypothetical protein
MKTVLESFDAALTQPGHGPRLRAVRSAAQAVREQLLDQPRVQVVRTLPLARLPYPARFAFQGAAWSPAPLVQMTHRCLLIQFRSGGALRTLLFNPSDVVANRATPFFADFIRAVGPLESLLAPPSPPLATQLAELGLTAEDIDYVAFDHFHTQDLRPLLGTVDGTFKPRFPRAVLLAPRSEWIDWDALHPMQLAWYIRDGKRNLRQERIQFLDGSLHLGDGVVLLRTPGHTSGNQTLLVRTRDGIWGCSENGTSADNWSPHASRMPGLARFVRKYQLEVLINSNTPELGAAQYTSMIAERIIVDVVADAPEFVRMFPSSEVTPGLWAPGASPTWLHHAVTDGALEVPPRAAMEVPHVRFA